MSLGRARARRSAGVLLCCLGVAALGCRSSEARQREASLAQLTHAIDALRDAPNPAKKPLLEALERAACDGADACKLKSDCVAAYAKLVAALDGSARTRALLAESDAGAVAALSAAIELNRAEQALNEAQSLSERCASSEGESERAAKKAR